MSVNSKAFIFLGEGKHKIKKKAEQIACEAAIRELAGSL
jgi:dsRNA-specific ribonuclease